ncbi:MAG: family 10 glycosylhydrolase [Clostridia bacterium]|nr:family 10 glycosylhydrolase [Clostridia bacterium]
MTIKRGLCVLLALLTLTGCAMPKTLAPEPVQADAIRAMWVPYMEVEALLGGGVDAAQKAIAACMDDLADRGVNTVYWHVRANADAYYASEQFPLSAGTAALVGAGLDPLSCAIEEAHARGIVLHAWVNPYRVGPDRARARCDDLMEADGRYYYVPTSAAAQAIIFDGVRELIEGYDVDGVQFDDYFYPAGAVPDDAPADFEAADFAAYQARGGTKTLPDWRRAEVSALIAAVCALCHTKAGCVFGVSPAFSFVSCRDRLYADVERWLSKDGFVDYLCPQLYVGWQNEQAPFEAVLAAWTTHERAPSVKLLAGLALYKAGLPEDGYAGSGRAEWATGGHIVADQIAAVKAASWDGVALYSHFAVGRYDGRDAAIAKEEETAAFAAWNTEYMKEK